MKQKSVPGKAPAEQVLKDIRRQTRRRYSAEENIRIVLEGLRGDENISELCRREGVAASMYYGWSKEFLEADKRRLAGGTARAATSGEVKDPRWEAFALKEVVADLTLENRLLKKSMNRASRQITSNSSGRMNRRARMMAPVSLLIGSGHVGEETGAAIDEWMKEIAPSTDLRKWFGHDPEGWSEFQRRYKSEIRQHPDQFDRLRILQTGRVTLAFWAHDEAHNDAVVLKDLLVGRG